jgi:hypothetical protein
MGMTMNFGWGWDNVAKYIEDVLLQKPHTAQTIVKEVIDQTAELYQGVIGDDATFVGLYIRQRNPLMVFTGPPLEEDHDEEYVDRLLGLTDARSSAAAPPATLSPATWGKSLKWIFPPCGGNSPPSAC